MSAAVFPIMALLCLVAVPNAHGQERAFSSELGSSVSELGNSVSELEGSSVSELASHGVSELEAISVRELEGSSVAELPLAKRQQYRIDAREQLDTAEMLAQDAQWRPVTGNNFGFTTDTYWFRVVLRNDTQSMQTYYLTVDYPLLDDVRLTLLNSKTHEVQATFATGDMLPFKSRPVDYPNFVFPLSLQPGADYVVLLRVATTSAMQVPLSLWQPDAYAAAKFTEAAVLGTIIGIMMFMGLYNLFLWTSIREASYLFGALCLGGFSLVQASLTGIAYGFFWPNFPGWNQISIVVTASAALCGLALFTHQFLQLNRHSPRLGLLAKLYAALCVASIGAAFVLPYQIMIQAVLLLVAAGSLMTYASSLYAWRREGVSEARFLVIGISFFVANAFVMILSKFSWIPQTFLTEYAIHIGAIIAVMFLAFALADRVNQERAAREKAQSEAITHLEKYRSIFENSLEGLFQIDLKGQLLAANPALATLFGTDSVEHLMEVSEVLQKTALVQDRTLQQILQRLENCEQVQGYETECRRLDGQRFWAALNARRVEDSSRGLSIVEGSIVDISERKASERRLNYLASHDSLTGLLNRLEFEQRLNEALARSRSSAEHHALLLMDLDRFKIVNDTGGHGAGDELLRQLAILFKQHVRGADSLARIGGDEFVILLQNCSLGDAEDIAQTLRQETSAYRFAWGEKIFSVGISIGIVGIHSESAGVEEVMSMADTACYTAKERGRNRVLVHHEQSIDIPLRRTEMELVAVMQEAIRNDDLVLFHQKVRCVNPAEERGDRYEILVRMRHNGEIMAPGAFLPAAERYNLISDLDRWVVDAYFRWLSGNPQALESLAQANINLSGQSVSDPLFANYIIETFDRYNIPPEKICFEITESAAISSLAETRAFIDRVRARGAHFALDDFGSGFSSYGYLKNLPVSCIKIDGSFIRDILSDPIDYEMVRSMTEVAHIMGLEVVAEYVETADILSKLRDLKVDLAQGWHLHKPEMLPQPSPMS